jgi:hypothetical protein
VRSAAVAFALLLTGAACHPPASSTEATQVAQGAAAVGTAAPDGAIALADGTATHLHEVFAAHPRTVLVFYRGFW